MDLETNSLVFSRQYPLILCHHWDLKYLGPESDWHTIRLAKQIGRACNKESTCGQSSSPFLRSAFIRNKPMVFLKRQCGTGHVCTQSQTLSPFHSFLSKPSVCACLLGHSVVSGSVAHQAPLSMGSPGKNTEVGCHSLLQGIFLT